MKNDKWEAQLSELKNIREKLEEKRDNNKRKSRKKKGRKGSKGRRSAFGGKSVAATTEYDDLQSVYTSQPSEYGNIPEKDKIKEDYFTAQGPPREFEQYMHEARIRHTCNEKFKENPCCQLSVLRLLECEDYDTKKAHTAFDVNVHKAVMALKDKWHTVDKDEIIRLIRYCIIREIKSIETRKIAIDFRKYQNEDRDAEDLILEA